MNSVSDSQAPPAPVRVRDIVDVPGLDLEVVAGRDALDRWVRGPRIQKSGLALAGHFHGIERGRIQVLGVTEVSYLRGLGAPERRKSLARFFALDLCCVVVTESAALQAVDDVVAPMLIELADQADTPLVFSRRRSSRTIMDLHALLDEQLAPRERLHGVLVDVFEVGVLLLGDSGVGKSEVALELIMRGHRLVADDVVECAFRPPGMVFGAAADLLRHHLEVRGLGILNIKDLFGVTAIRDRKRVDVVVQLVKEGEEAEHDRLGLERREHLILGVGIRELRIAVRPGRDMASILEIAARSELLRQAGHDPTQAFLDRIDALATRPRPTLVPARRVTFSDERSRLDHAPVPPESTVDYRTGAAHHTRRGDDD